MRRAHPSQALALALFLGLLLGLNACVAQSLPGMVGDPQTPPGEAPDVPITGSGEGVVVEYVAVCRGCTARFSTPDGVGSEDEINGTFSRRVRFTNAAAPGAVALTVAPGDDGRVQAARIRIDGRVVAEEGPLPLGEIANLSAVVR